MPAPGHHRFPPSTNHTLTPNPTSKPPLPPPSHTPPAFFPHPYTPTQPNLKTTPHASFPWRPAHARPRRTPPHRRHAPTGPRDRVLTTVSMRLGGRATSRRRARHRPPRGTPIPLTPHIKKEAGGRFQS
eukprot:365598-Chlamydomonas_euryale.AAC.6